MIMTKDTMKIIIRCASKQKQNRKNGHHHHYYYCNGWTHWIECLYACVHLNGLVESLCTGSKFFNIKYTHYVCFVWHCAQLWINISWCSWILRKLSSLSQWESVKKECEMARENVECAKCSRIFFRHWVRQKTCSNEAHRMGSLDTDKKWQHTGASESFGTSTLHEISYLQRPINNGNKMLASVHKCDMFVKENGQ